MNRYSQQEDAAYHAQKPEQGSQPIRVAMAAVTAKASDMIGIALDVEAAIFGPRLKATETMSLNDKAPEPMPDIRLSGERLYSRLEELEKILLTLRGRL